MPELPEVETVRRGLARLLPGKKIVSVWHDWPGSKPGEYVSCCAGSGPGRIADFSRQRSKATPSRKNQQSAKIDSQLATENTPTTYSKSFPNSEPDVQAFLIGARVLEVKRRAKVLLIELDSKYSLVIHLKMTGQLVYVQGSTLYSKAKRFGAGHPNDSLIGELPDKSTRVIFDLVEDARQQNVRGLTSHKLTSREMAVQKKARLFFNDQRKFGWVRLIPTMEVPNIDFFLKVGPEPLGADFTAKAFIERLNKRPKSNIKAVLLDQTIIAGVGNIYADESLFAAKIHPVTRVNDLDDRQKELLFHELRRILELSIQKGGSSDRNYVDAEGKKGSYLTFAQVFRREGQPCPRCAATIIKTRVAARGTHICPNCQKST